MSVYITSLGTFLPGPPIANDEMESYLGLVGGKPSRVRQRILKQNGIQFRHYAIDQRQQSLFSNAEMTAEAARSAVARAGLTIADVDFIAAATSQGDFPLPGFASMVHGELQSPPCELATVHGICASGVMAIKAAALQVAAGKQNALACAGEFASRLFKASRFDDQELVRAEGPTFDAEFLRWMLSDGAGAAMLSPSPLAGGISLKVEWIELRSFANKFQPCMYVGPAKQAGRIAQGWLDYPNYRSAADAGAINLRQDIRMLKDVVRYAVGGLLQVAKEKSLAPEQVDWLAVHYSSHFFREQSATLAAKAGFHVPAERWFSNLSTTGNVGSASTPPPKNYILQAAQQEGILDDDAEMPLPLWLHAAHRGRWCLQHSLLRRSPRPFMPRLRNWRRGPTRSRRSSSASSRWSGSISKITCRVCPCLKSSTPDVSPSRTIAPCSSTCASR